MKRLLNIFKKREEPTAIIEVPVGIPVVINPKPKTKPKNQKPNKTKFIQFKGYMDGHFHGVLLDTKPYTTKKKKKASPVHIVLVVKQDNSSVVPYLKWINDEYCSECEPFPIDYIQSRYLDIDNWDTIKGELL